MPVIYLNAAHTHRSPGGVWGGVTEHGECLRLCNALKSTLNMLAPRLEVRVTEGNFIFPPVKNGDMLLIFHKGINEMKENKHGAGILVKSDADAAYQYRAFRLLTALCGDSLRYRGVHTATDGSPFGFFVNTPAREAYLITAGYIESERDTEAVNQGLRAIALRLSQEIIKIYKEKANEDNT